MDKPKKLSVIKSEVKNWVGWANSSTVNPTFLAKVVLGCQKTAAQPTYFFISLLITPM